MKITKIETSHSAPNAGLLLCRIHTDEGLVATHKIRERFPEVGVLLLSQYVETEFAVELVSAGAAKLGYLLKDRVANVQEFTDSVRRVGAGGSVIDPEVVSRLVGLTVRRAA